MKPFLYILAPLLALAAPLALAENAIGTHLKADTEYLACMLRKIPEASRGPTALILWPVPVPGPGKTCGTASVRLSASEINGLREKYEGAHRACESTLPSDQDARTDADLGLLGVLLINPKDPTNTRAWDELMSGSAICTSK